MDPKLKKQSAFLAALAKPTRLGIVRRLASGEKNVTQLAQLLNLEIVNVSHHLGVMKAAGLVNDRKDGRFVIYGLIAGNGADGVDVSGTDVNLTCAGLSVSLPLN